MLEARFHQSCFNEIAIVEKGIVFVKSRITNHIIWFDISPDAGDPDCICSWCNKVIGEDEVPIRVFKEGKAG